MPAPASASVAAGRGVYVTGTDTGVGKSVTTAALLAALNAAGVRAIGMKPVASGSEATPQGLRNADAELLRTHSAGTPAYADVNPCTLVPPIAPHIAAHEAGVSIALPPLRAAYARLAADADRVLVEGVGGWMAPLACAPFQPAPTAQPLMQADVARALGLPVILVVGLRLGCLNHALLSARAIAADGCRLVGWIGNRIDAHMLRAGENLATLRALLPAPCLGVLPHRGDAESAVDELAPALAAAVTALR